ncbi:MAG: hypothetical protein JRF40_13705 [Deltaproteobacteria bacterium]|nr:hypothetical protein [Deltaproteobacteria bacterium]
MISIFLMVGLSGCASHYYRIEADRLHLYLKNPEANKIYFSYSLDKFELHPAKKIDAETWMVILPADREFSYFYIADKEVFLPVCRFTELDDFGSRNCIFIPGL